MPSLQERPDDIRHLTSLFIKEAASTLMLDPQTLDTQNIELNLSKNTKSLKKSIFLHLIKQSMGAKDIEAIVYDYLHTHLGGNDAYREHLSLYEKPLIEAGLKKFGSQLQLSQVLGINRNTLRKKIHEHKID
jgi:DNA-binding NtrC family response regulator